MKSLGWMRETGRGLPVPGRHRRMSEKQFQIGRASLRSVSLTMAAYTNTPSVSDRYSYSSDGLRLPTSHANAHSATQHRGNATNPFEPLGRSGLLPPLPCQTNYLSQPIVPTQPGSHPFLKSTIRLVPRPASSAIYEPAPTPGFPLSRE